jgi:TRAP-type mannitol/chloroaromatic compound transport system permease large subunit
MSWASVLTLMFASKVGLLLTALPVAFVFFVINIVGSYLIFGGLPGLEQMVRNEQLSVAQFSLVPIPFFVLMGEVLFHTGLAMKSIDAVDAVIRRVPGRLAVVALVAGTVFSAISGSTIATTAMLGSLLLPQMLERRY